MRKLFLRRHIPFGRHNFLSMLEGVEGGFAISTGIIAGLAFAAPTNRHLLFITAAITILVNGFNASAIKFSSEHYDDELDGREKRNFMRFYLLPAALEFLIYMVVCLLTIIPLVFIESLPTAVLLCAGLTLIILFAAGFWRGRLLQTHPVRDGLELATLGALIIVVGATAGFVLTR